MPETTVIVPFYQQDTGILTRCLDCIFAQSTQDLTVIVVDDASPLSAQPEVDGRPAGERWRIKVVKQKNGGPGSARNTGLDHVGPDTPFIAFMDSDDVWTRDHLAKAIAALNAGYDFYFSDYTWPTKSSTRFKQTDLASLGRALPADPALMALDETDFVELVLTRWPVHVSATVIRAAALGGVRFDERLRYSSEDQMYFIQCGLSSSRICCRNEVTMQLADGLNLFRRQPAGTRGFSRSRIANAYFHKLVRQALADRPGTRSLNDRLLRGNLVAFVRSELKALVYRRRLHVSLYPQAVRVFLDSALLR